MSSLFVERERSQQENFCPFLGKVRDESQTYRRKAPLRSQNLLIPHHVQQPRFKNCLTNEQEVGDQSEAFQRIFWNAVYLGTPSQHKIQENV
jgi:hypothetical protein